tara:strand:- start:22 stop:1158 length:1137 start_codon:yes stop_codon:yes gene_type:complete
MALKNNIVILGSTGVLGTKLLNYLHKNNLKISLITCFSNYKKLYKQKKQTKTNLALVLDPKIPNNNNNLNYGDELLLNFIKKKPISFFYVLDTGFESLKYIELIINFQKNCTIAIANKEILVAGGKLLIDNIINSKNKILPLDSEHFSLFYLLSDRKNIKYYISKIYLTASGGPFYFDKNFNIKNVTLKNATKHPIWKMGFKNSIDSSNLVNKILECFELSSLYNFPLSNIGITISPKAFAHSVVFYSDQRISINCFQNDMMIPLTSPFSSDTYYKKPKSDINIINSNNLNFIKFNNKKFQIYKYLNKIINFSHTEQILFMMLNAESVNRFIANKITYSQIIPFIFNNINNLPNKKNFKNLYEIINYTNMLSSILKKL